MLDKDNQSKNGGIRFILGDAYNKCLSLLVIKYDNQFNVEGMEFEKLGTVSAPTCIAYLDNRCLFVGSMAGNHQVVRLHSQKKVRRKLLKSNIQSGFYFCLFFKFKIKY